jgi:hypothetical protein
MENIASLETQDKKYKLEIAVFLNALRAEVLKKQADKVKSTCVTL